MLRPERLAALILRPCVALTLGWAMVVVARLLFAVPTAVAPARGETLRFVSPGEFLVGSLIHALLATALLVDLRWARRAPVGLRRAQLTAGFGALLLLAQLQVLGTLAFQGVGLS